MLNGVELEDAGSFTAVTGLTDVIGVTTATDVAGVTTVTDVIGITFVTDVKGVAILTDVTGVAILINVTGEAIVTGVAIVTDVTGVAIVTAVIGEAIVTDVTGVGFVTNVMGVTGVVSSAAPANVATPFVMPMEADPALLRPPPSPHGAAVLGTLQGRAALDWPQFLFQGGRLASDSDSLLFSMATAFCRATAEGGTAECVEVGGMDVNDVAGETMASSDLLWFSPISLDIEICNPCSDVSSL